MKSIIFKTIIFIVILIVSFFIVKYLLNRPSALSNVKENLVIEDFQSNSGSGSSFTNLETVFGINGVDNDYFGFDINNTPTKYMLENHFLHPKEFIDINNENERDKCLTKYLGLYNLIVFEEDNSPPIDLTERLIEPQQNDFPGNTFNKTLEDGFYGTRELPNLENPKNILGVKYLFDETNQKDEYTYLSPSLLERIKDMNIKPIKLNKFKAADSSEESEKSAVNNFIDFGVKNHSDKTPNHHNFYIKNIRFLLKDSELESIKKSINKSVFNLTTSITLDSFLIKSVIGDSNEGGSVKGILSKLHDDIFGKDLESDSILEILGEGNTTPTRTECVIDKTECVIGTGVTTSTCTNITKCATVDEVDETPGSTTSGSTINNITLKDKMYREYIIYIMELLYCKMSSSLEGNEEIANTIFNLDNKPNTILAISAIKEKLPNFDKKLNIENTSINLSYYYSLVLTLLKLRTKIIKDQFLSKFNCKYITYLFYSFNRAETIFGDYINNIDLDNDEKEMLNKFFSSFEFEGLYKLLILSVKGECNIFFENETNSAKIEDGLSLTRIIEEKIIDFNQKYYFFFKKENTRRLNESCKKVKREDCNELNTRGICSWQSTSTSDPTKGECAASINLTDKCMYIESDKCNMNPYCYLDNGVCKPSNCSDGTNCLLNDSNGNPIPHCRSLTFEENGDIKKKCFDKERVMFISSESDNIKHSNPDSFFKRSYNHLNECEDGIYNYSTDSFTNNAEETCAENGSKSCNFLNKNTVEHNQSNFRTCVHDELVDVGNFFSCSDIKEQEKCDSKTSRSLSCFWQDGKCYKRDAPLHWITPGTNDYGIEDMTDCQNFSSEFSCPVDRCIWHNESCIRKEDHPYYDEEEVSARAPPSVEKIIPIKKELVDCEAINNNSNSDRIDASVECNSFKCKWDLNHKICSAKVGNSCALHKSKSECLDTNTNYDSTAQQNMCRWSENMSKSYCDKITNQSDCNRADLCEYDNVNNKCNSKRGEFGFCTDTRMLQPCQLFDKENCPTEVKVDNMGNKIPGSNHCILNGDFCINNPEIFTDGEYDTCHYNYLNTGNCDENTCRLKDLYDSKHTGLNIKKCVARESMPCSMLTREECVRPIVGDSCYWDSDNSKCSPTQNMDSLKNVLSNVANIGNNEYKQIQAITKEFDNIDFVTNENKKYYMRDIEPIMGLVTKLEKKGDTQLIYTNTDNVKRVSIGDFIEVKSDSNLYRVSPNTELNTFKVKSVDIYDKIIEIETNNSAYNLISINSQIGDSPVNINNIATASVKWIIKTPNLGLFGSYQHSQAMIDSMKINDFYNNFF